MSKTDALRAMREKRWALRQQELASRTRAVEPPTKVPAPPAPVTAPDPAVQDVPAPALVEPVPVPAATAGRPEVDPGKVIGAYRQTELEALVGWLVASHRVDAQDGQGVLAAVMAELGFVRRGKVICSRVDAALATVTGRGSEAPDPGVLGAEGDVGEGGHDVELLAG